MSYPSIFRLCLLLYLASLLTVFSAWAQSQGQPASQPNVVFLIADDLGIDWAPCYSAFGLMPNMERFCRQGVVFDQAFANPLCTPTRASMITGRYTLRTGAGNLFPGQPKLPLKEVTIAELLALEKPGEYLTAAFGKWHLEDENNGLLTSPNKAGFDYFVGTLPNNNALYSYFKYPLYENGKLLGWYTKYRTTQTVDLVIDYFRDRGKDHPIFAWVGFVNPHHPFHLPPNDLHTFDFLTFKYFAGSDNQLTPVTDTFELNKPLPEAKSYFAAMIQALDTEIGRLVREIDAISNRPTVYIFLGDNGTSGEIAIDNERSPHYRYKGTAFNQGIHVPLVIWSSKPGLLRSPAREDALVNLSDLFTTALNLMGVSSDRISARVSVHDSRTLNPLLTNTPGFDERDWIYSEKGGETIPFMVTVRNKFYKLNIFEGTFFRPPTMMLHNVKTDYNEESDLISAGLTREQVEGLAPLLDAFIGLYESEPKPYLRLDVPKLLSRYRDTLCAHGVAFEKFVCNP